MNLNDLKSQVALGEDSRRQFKRDVTNVDSLAAEMAAFANSGGGAIYLGVADDGQKELSDVETEYVGERTPGETLGKTPRKTPDKILVLLREGPRLAIPDLAASIGKSESAVERAIRRLCEQNQLRRIGPAKGGYWEVVE